MNLVDTPGTNSPFKRHQEITESFLPRADIVFFVTSIDCPLTQTELTFLADIRRRWRKEVACILAKIDMRPYNDHVVVLEYLSESFREHLGFSPPVFPVAARQAREAREANDVELLARSGMPEVERYIVENLSEQPLRTGSFVPEIQVVVGLSRGSLSETGGKGGKKEK